jgi:methylaspartate ammonia-lyase
VDTKSKNKNMSTSTLLYEALELKYLAQIAEAKATLSIYFENSVGIGEHPQHLEEMDKLISQLADAQDKLEALNQLTFNQNQSLPF